MNITARLNPRFQERYVEERNLPRLDRDEMRVRGLGEVETELRGHCEYPCTLGRAIVLDWAFQ